MRGGVLLPRMSRYRPRLIPLTEWFPLRQFLGGFGGILGTPPPCSPPSSHPPASSTPGCGRPPAACEEDDDNGGALKKFYYFEILKKINFKQKK